MNSMTEVKKVFRIGVGVALAAVAMSAVQANAGVVAGGVVPVINQVRAIGNTSIDLSADGVDVNLVGFTVDNNTPGGFILDVVMTEGGFVPIGGTVATGIALTVVDVIENTVLNTATSGALGTGAAAWADLTQAAPAAAATMTAPYTSGAQSTATVDYSLTVTGSWTADPDLLAGFYGETFIVNLTAVF